MAAARIVISLHRQMRMMLATRTMRQPKKDEAKAKKRRNNCRKQPVAVVQLIQVRVNQLWNNFSLFFITFILI